MKANLFVRVKVQVIFLILILITNLFEFKITEALIKIEAQTA
jgi:hypothetical protein